MCALILKASRKKGHLSRAAFKHYRVYVLAGCCSAVSRSLCGAPGQTGWSRAATGRGEVVSVAAGAAGGHRQQRQQRHWGPRGRGTGGRPPSQSCATLGLGQFLLWVKHHWRHKRENRFSNLLRGLTVLQSHLGRTLFPQGAIRRETWETIGEETQIWH